MPLADIKTWVDIVQGTLTALAILSAGFWSFYIFILGRAFTVDAQIEIKHTVIHTKDLRRQVLIDITARNTGRTAIKKLTCTMTLNPIELSSPHKEQQPFRFRRIDPSVKDMLSAPATQIDIFQEQLYLEPHEEAKEAVLIELGEKTSLFKLTILLRGKRAAIIGGPQYWLSSVIIDSRS
jgi:hypothetical protein